MLDGDVAADVADAEAALTKLNVQASSLVDTEALARLLLRAESWRLQRSKDSRSVPAGSFEPKLPENSETNLLIVTAVEVLGNIDAMQHGIKFIHTGDLISVELILQIHKRLLRGSHLEDQGGQVPKRPELDRR